MALHALGDVRADDRATAEIVDDLLQKAEAPFRTGHHFASKLTDFRRGKGLKLQEIPFAEVARIYQEQAKAALPLSEGEYANIISAETMVFGRKGLDGSQVDELQQTLVKDYGRMGSDSEWHIDHNNSLGHFAKAFDKQHSGLVK